MENGKIVSVGETQEKGNFQWREVVVDVSTEKYTRQMMLKASKYTFDFTHMLTVGLEVEIVYPGEAASKQKTALCVQPQSREYNDRWYTDLSLTKII